MPKIKLTVNIIRIEKAVLFQVVEQKGIVNDFTYNVLAYGMIITTSDKLGVNIDTDLVCLRRTEECHRNFARMFDVGVKVFQTNQHRDRYSYRLEKSLELFAKQNNVELEIKHEMTLGYDDKDLNRWFKKKGVIE
jgi:hypothetical protein